MYVVGLRCATAAALSKSHFFTVYILNSSRLLSVSTFDDSAGKMAMVFFRLVSVDSLAAFTMPTLRSCALYSSHHERGAATRYTEERSSPFFCRRLEIYK